MNIKVDKEEMARGKTKTGWKIYLTALIISLGAVAFFFTTLLFRFIALKEWTVAFLFGSLLLFVIWLLVTILQLKRTKKPTVIGAVMEEDAYYIHAPNQWPRDDKTVKISYNQFMLVLIGVWTNSSFKVHRPDDVGAKCISLYTDSKGHPAYSTSIILDETILDLWVSRLQKNNVPIYTTGRNITMATAAHYDELLRTIDALPYDGTMSIRAFFAEQGDLSFWWPANKADEK